MHRGHVKIWRKVEESGLLGHPKAWALFTWLLINATWKPLKYATRYGVIEIKPGQVIIGRERLAKVLKQSSKNIRTALNLLKTTGVVASESNNHFTVITIVKWLDYQCNPHKVTSEFSDGEASEVASEVASRRPADGQQTATEQEGKNVSIEENTVPTVPSVSYKEHQDYLWYAIKRKNPEAIWVKSKWIHTQLSTFALQVPFDRWEVWVDNYEKDPFVRAWTLEGFLKDPSKFSKLREAKTFKEISEERRDNKAREKNAEWLSRRLG
jgi:hypothetical protein